MNESEEVAKALESFPWERPLDRRELIAKTAAAGGAIAAAGVLATGARAAPTAISRARRTPAASTLFVANYGDMQNLDPHTSSADTVTGDILTNLYSIPVTFVVQSRLGPGHIGY